ncbi:tetratricopeptide repeat protein [Yinghuangia seranimata]|uniref:tetratricopeptide repeat protein n=1 Tax=Yinghuangia seranimata TaxID=408067 RepID=UPI00248B4FE8|nr:tetratricopeptide repeat protein [Yinghuangia seranimata]MDI2130509.1 tetratricopeptide repeat protein [Yinghuangia seranimata]
MAFWRKKRTRPKRADDYVGDFGSAEIKVTERRGEPLLVDINLTMTAEYAYSLDFQHKRMEFGLHHPETLHALHVYAVALGDVVGRRDDAIELLNWLVAARTDDQENQLLALNDLTRLLQDNGDFALAEERLREALSGWERLRGQNDGQTLQIASNLAIVLIELGRREEAEGLMRDTVARRTRTLGATHPDTLNSRNTLAGALRGSPARLTEAERMYRAILVDSDGAADLALTARHNLAAVVAFQGKHDEALRMYRELIDARSQRLGDDHPDTWAARHNCAVVLDALGRAAEAETLLTGVLQGYQRARGPRHVETLGVQVDLAAMRANLGRNADAVPLLRDAIEGYRGIYGPSHPLVRELNSVLGRLST